MKLVVLEAMNLLTKLNLQYFAEGEEGTSDGEGAGQEQGAEGQAEQQQEKSFSQKDVNNIVAKESKKALESFLKENGIEDFKTAKEGMAKFKEWQESQKSEQQKQAEALETANKTLEQVNAEKFTLSAQLAAFKAGTNADSLEDVITLAQPKVSDEVTIEQAIAQVLEKYPHFKGAGEEKKDDKPSFSGGTHTPPASGDMTLEKFAKMSYAARVEFQTKNPEQFKKLTQNK